jgi:hypothetical protein
MLFSDRAHLDCAGQVVWPKQFQNEEGFYGGGWTGDTIAQKYAQK